MPSSPVNSSVFARFIAPLLPFQDSAQRKYTCHQVPDSEWINTGLQRVIGDHRSGCAFIQARFLRDELDLSKSHYFESLKSSRRHDHLASISQQFIQANAQLTLKENDIFGADPALKKALENFHLYAGDGHFHAASSHDKRDEKGIKNAVGHLYALNLRNQFLSHLALSSDGTKKKPHDMGVLKKLDIQTLRQGATKGQKVIYTWDRAGIDFRQWNDWKHQHGIYFISRVKKNMKLEHPLPQDFKKDDPINAGIISDELVSNQCGTMIRRVRYRIPETGEVMEYLTNLGKSISPGIIAQLYYMRWRIEKTFDELKNKLYEIKAWAASLNAKKMQATFIVLAYNLAQVLDQEIESQLPESEQQDKGNEKKKEERMATLKKKLEARGDVLPELRAIYRKPSQLSVIFYRWLSSHLHDPAPWATAQSRLATLYANF
jgi:hypothetical protein